MDGGIEQNPAYGTARPFTYAECVVIADAATLLLTLTGSKNYLCKR